VRRRRYSLADYLAAMGLTVALTAPAPFYWAPPVWILVLLMREAIDR
jgi:hypothetical protein